MLNKFYLCAVYTSGGTPDSIVDESAAGAQSPQVMFDFDDIMGAPEEIAGSQLVGPPVGTQPAPEEQATQQAAQMAQMAQAAPVDVLTTQMAQVSGSAQSSGSASSS